MWINCASKYYLLLVVYWTWTCELSGWVSLTSNIPLVKITFYYDYRWCAFLIFFLIDARTTFPMYKKERERRSRAFPSDSNPDYSQQRSSASERLQYLLLWFGTVNQLDWHLSSRQGSNRAVGSCVYRTTTVIYSLGHGLCAPFLQCLGQLSLLPSVGR